MENDSLPEYVEEIPINHLSREQYLVVLNKAAKQLRWQVVNVSADSITFHTQGANNFLGETVTLLIADDKILFSSKAMNEYYQRDNQNEINELTN